MSLLFLVHAICQPASLIVLGISAAIDLKDRVIPNELVVAIAVIGFAQGLALRPGLVWFSLLVAIIVFFGLWIVAHVKIIGGGDLKLISAVTLLVPPDRVGQLLIDIVLAGGLLSCFYLAAHYGLKRLPEPRSAAAEAAPSAKKSGFVRTLKAECIRIGGGYPMPYAVAVLGGVIVYNAMQFLQP